MIEIGKKRTKVMRVLIKDATGKRTFKPRIGADGQPETVLVANEPVRVTVGTLDGHFCRDRGRKLVVVLKDGDILQLRPQGTRQAAAASLFDIYAWMLRTAADHAKMAKLREAKAQKAQRRAERALRHPLRLH